MNEFLRTLREHFMRVGETIYFSGFPMWVRFVIAVMSTIIFDVITKIILLFLIYILQLRFMRVFLYLGHIAQALIAAVLFGGHGFHQTLESLVLPTLGKWGEIVDMFTFPTMSAFWRYQAEVLTGNRKKSKAEEAMEPLKYYTGGIMALILVKALPYVSLSWWVVLFGGLAIGIATHIVSWDGKLPQNIRVVSTLISWCLTIICGSLWFFFWNTPDATDLLDELQVAAMQEYVETRPGSTAVREALQTDSISYVGMQTPGLLEPHLDALFGRQARNPEKEWNDLVDEVMDRHVPRDFTDTRRFLTVLNSGPTTIQLLWTESQSIRNRLQAEAESDTLPSWILSLAFFALLCTIGRYPNRISVLNNTGPEYSGVNRFREDQQGGD